MKRLGSKYYLILLLSGLFLFFLFVSWSPPKRIRVVSYNVENLFDTIPSGSYADLAFSPNGEYRWNRARYQRKLSNISTVLNSINGWELPGIIAFSEVENSRVVEELLYRTKHDIDGSPYFNFDITNGKDSRGINVAIAWDRRLFRKIGREDIPSYSVADTSHFPGRHTLYLVLETLFSYRRGTMTADKDSLHLYAIHLPSRRGGVRESEQKRILAAKNIRNHLSDLISRKPKAKIIIMGDANEDPKDPATLLLSDSLLHLCKEFSDRGLYSHYFQGKGWTPDHIIVSPSLVQSESGTLCIESPMAQVYAPLFLQDKRFSISRPLRFLSGEFYNGGYSDHFPIYIDLNYGKCVTVSQQ